MILSATLKREAVEGGVVRYVDSYGGDDSFFSEPVVIKASTLPDPPPALLRVELSWYQIPVERGEVRERESALRTAAARKIAEGDRVKVIKSRTSNVRNPPERLEQHLDKVGVVVWVTPGGAHVDLGTEVVWFAYDELERVS